MRSSVICSISGICVLVCAAALTGSAHAAGVPVGMAPESVSIADVNGDGIPDIVTANATDSTVSVLIGNGDGTFQAAVAYSTGASTGPSGLVVADVNGDGKPDIITANTTTNTVSILTNAGGGVFNAATQLMLNGGLANGSSPGAPVFFLTVADINGDGKPDILTANNGSANVSVLINSTTPFPSAAPTFQTADNYPCGNDPATLAVGDFNGDGKLDIATANFGDSTVSILLNTGIVMPGMEFSAPTALTAGSGCDAVAVGDFNGDGKLDLIAGNDDGDSCSLFLGVGNGTFQPAVTLTSGPGTRQVLTADFNGDGKLDFAVVNDDDTSNTERVQIYLGNGDGTFQPPANLQAPVVATTATAPVAFAIGDLNKDGKLDLALANPADNNVLILLGPLPGQPPVIASAVATDPANNPVSDVAVGEMLTFTATATDPLNKPLTFTWDFGDGTFPLATGNPVTHSYTFASDYFVTLTVSNGEQEATQTLDISVMMPNSGATDVTNLEDGSEELDPESGLGLEQTVSDDGIVDFHVDEGQLRDVLTTSTDFSAVGGRGGTVIGTVGGLNPGRLFTTPGVFVAHATARNSAGVMMGQARKTIVIGNGETGVTPILPKPGKRTPMKSTVKGSFTFSKVTTQSLTTLAKTGAVKSDSVTFSGILELPPGMDLSQPQQFAAGIGNVIDTVMVDSKGKGKLPGAGGNISKLQIRYPKTGKGSALTTAGQTATVQLTLSGTDLSSAGFNTEGITNNLQSTEKNLKTIARKVQLAFVFGGVTYFQTLNVSFAFKAGKNGSSDTGSIGGRSSQ